MKTSKETQRRRRLVKQAKELWEKAVIDEYGELCVCGKPMHEIHHFYRKSQYGHLRFVIANGVPICQGCHIRADSPIFIDFLKDWRGEKWYQDLKDLALHPPANFKSSPKWIKEEIQRLKSI